MYKIKLRHITVARAPPRPHFLCNLAVRNRKAPKRGAFAFSVHTAFSFISKPLSFCTGTHFQNHSTAIALTSVITTKIP